ncbi:4353_t:CDS:2, partial [Ambispora leptoticha]
HNFLMALVKISRAIFRNTGIRSPLANGFWLTRTFATTVINNPRKDDQGNELKIEITDRAVKVWYFCELRQQLLSIMTRDKNDHEALRITVDSGGCHGFQYFYDLTSVNALEDDDVLFEKNGAKVVIDSLSLGLIKGSKIDYTEELIGSQFKVVDNPQASSGCG